MDKRKVVVIIGSDSDLPQCLPGLVYLTRMQELSRVEVVAVITASIHRNTEDVLKQLRKLHKDNQVDALIVGAGWANHLTGTVDAFLRYALKDDKIVVFGVAFSDENDVKHTEAAILSITQVPGSQVVFNDYVGEAGFLEACQSVVNGDLPKIKVKDPKPPRFRQLSEAVLRAQQIEESRRSK